MHHGRWDDALFVSFPVDSQALSQRIPQGLVIDEHDGVAYVSIVALTEAAIIPWPPGVPIWLLRWMGLSHHALNVRTYVRPAAGREGPPGIFFFSLDCSAALPTIGARALFNLPYRYASMRRRTVMDDDGARSGTAGSQVRSLESHAVLSKVAFSSEWVASPSSSPEEDQLGRFLVERYALYNAAGACSAVGLLARAMHARSSTWCGSITHKPWPLYRARLISWCTNVLEAVDLHTSVRGEPIAHCSSGVDAITFFWRGFLCKLE